MTFITESAEQTRALGVRLARSLDEKGSFVAMYGEMGAGKTVLVSAMVSVLSPNSRVTSPTYTIANEYLRGSVPVYHFDLCRLADADELDSFGFSDYIGNGHILVEWADILGDDLPQGAICVKISADGDRRTIEIDGIDALVDDDKSEMENLK